MVWGRVGPGVGPEQEPAVAGREVEELVEADGRRSQRARVLSLVNQKGGVGKTTSAVNLGYALALKGRRVLLIDLDPQAALSRGLGVDLEEAGASMYAVMTEERALEDILLEIPAEVPVEAGGDAYGGGPASGAGAVLDLAPAMISMTRLGTHLKEQPVPAKVLPEVLAPVLKDYDFVIVDCHPDLGVLEQNALAAADGLIVPLKPENYSLPGTKDLSDMVKVIRRRANPDLEILGVLFTMVDKRTRVSGEVMDVVTRNFEDKIFETRIRVNTTLAEVPFRAASIFEYAPKSRGAQDYRDLAEEVMRRVQ